MYLCVCAGTNTQHMHTHTTHAHTRVHTHTQHMHTHAYTHTHTHTHNIHTTHAIYMQFFTVTSTLFQLCSKDPRGPFVVKGASPSAVAAGVRELKVLIAVKVWQVCSA